MSQKRPTLKELKEFKYRINPEEKQGAYGYYFIRPLSLYITWICLQFPSISANQVTVWQAIVGIIGCAFIGVSGTVNELIGLFLLQFGFILDNVDGEIARFRNTASINGKYLDQVNHQVVVPMMYFAIGFGIFMKTGQLEMIIFGFLGALASLRIDIATMYTEIFGMLDNPGDKNYDYYAHKYTGNKTDKSIYATKKRAESKLIRSIYAMFSYPALMNIFMLFMIADMFLTELELPIMENFNSLTYYFLAFLGIAVPINRVRMMNKIVQTNTIVNNYLEISEKMQKKN